MVCQTFRVNKIMPHNVLPSAYWYHLPLASGMSLELIGNDSFARGEGLFVSSYFVAIGT